MIYRKARTEHDTRVETDSK